MTFNSWNRLIDRIPWRSIGLIVLIGAVIERLYIYLQTRSIMLDEANLLGNLIQRSYSGLFQPLDYNQYAPPLFSVLVKGAMELTDTMEYAWQFWPMLFGIASLWLLWKLGNRILGAGWSILPVVLIGYSYYFLRYSTEVKQYSGDIMVTLLLIYLALGHQRLTWKQTLWWSALGAVIVWFSMPSTFVLAAIGIAWFLKSIRNWTPSNLGKIALIGITWLGSFSAYYWFILRHDLFTDYLQGYHESYFVSLNPARWQEQLDLFKELFFTMDIMRGWIFGIPFLIVIIFGIIHLIKHARYRFLLLMGPILVCGIASLFHLYSLLPRLGLFLIPLLAIIGTLGLKQVTRSLPKGIKTIPVVWAVVLVFSQIWISLYILPLEVDAVKPAMRYMQESRSASEFIYVHHEATSPFWIYSTYHPEFRQQELKPNYLAPWDVGLDSIPNKTNGLDSYWLLIAHREIDSTQQLLNNLPNDHVIHDREEWDRAQIYHIDIK